MHFRILFLCTLCACGPLDSQDSQSDAPGLSSDRGSLQWAVDTSGAKFIPNQWVAHVSELKVTKSIGSSGALYDPERREVMMRFELKDRSLTFSLHTLRPGRYDLSGIDGHLEVLVSGSGKYGTDVRGGYGTLVLETASNGFLRGTFEGRYCFDDTPGANCSRFYGGAFEVRDLATGHFQEPAVVDYAIPVGFPQLDPNTRIRMSWADGVEGRSRTPFWSHEGKHNLSAKLAPEPLSEGYTVGLRLTSLDPGTYALGGELVWLTQSVPGQNAIYTSRADGNGSIVVAGRNAKALWGTFEGKVCFATTPGANCTTFSGGKFSAAIE